MVKSDVCHFRHYITSKKIPNCVMFLCVWVETIDWINWNSIAMLCHSIQFEMEHSSDSHILNSTYKLWKDERQITDSGMRRFRVIRYPLTQKYFSCGGWEGSKVSVNNNSASSPFYRPLLHKTPLETVLLLNNRKVWIGIHKNIVRPPNLNQLPWSSTDRFCFGISPVIFSLSKKI